MMSDPTFSRMSSYQYSATLRIKREKSMQIIWMNTTWNSMLKTTKDVSSLDRCGYSRRGWTRNHVNDRYQMLLDTNQSSKRVTTSNMTLEMKTRRIYQWPRFVQLHMGQILGNYYGSEMAYRCLRGLWRPLWILRCSKWVYPRLLSVWYNEGRVYGYVKVNESWSLYWAWPYEDGRHRFVDVVSCNKLLPVCVNADRIRLGRLSYTNENRLSSLQDRCHGGLLLLRK